MRVLLPFLLVVGVVACGPDTSVVDGSMDASCTLEVTIGTGDRNGFMPAIDGQPAELILGFQGFRMVELALKVGGPMGGTADLTSWLEVPDRDIELSQRNRVLPIVEGDGGSGIIEDHLIFFNDAPAAELIGQEVAIEIILRSGGCIGTATARLTLQDEHECVDFGVEIPDAGVLDGGVPDGSVACEGME